MRVRICNVLLLKFNVIYAICLLLNDLHYSAEHLKFESKNIETALNYAHIPFPAMSLELELQQLVRGKSMPSCKHQLVYHEVSFPKPETFKRTLTIGRFAVQKL